MKIPALSQADERAGEVGSQLRKLVQDVSEAALASGAKNRAHAVMILSYGINGLLHFLARTIQAERPQDDHTVGSVEALTAALMGYHVAPTCREDGKVAAEFNPLVIYNALVDFEKMNGVKPDDALIPQLCEAARECAADKELVAEVARLRALDPDGIVKGRSSNHSLH